MTAQALALLALLVPAAAPDAGRIAVLEFGGAKVDAEALHAMTDEARSAAAHELRPRGWVVMTRESMALLVREMGGVCADGECEVETARNIGATLVMTGEVRVIGGEHLLQLKLHETATASLLAAEMVRAPTAIELIERTKTAAAALLRTGLAPAPLASVEPREAERLPPAAEDAPNVPLPNAAQDVLVLAAKPGRVSLPHRAHRGTRCTSCHEDARGGAIPRLHASGAKDFAHGLCVGCHKTRVEGPVKCAACHRR